MVMITYTEAVGFNGHRKTSNESVKDVMNSGESLATIS